MGVNTSAIFYRRGVPNNNRRFGILVQANYSFIQPQGVFLNPRRFKIIF